MKVLILVATLLMSVNHSHSLFTRQNDVSASVQGDVSISPEVDKPTKSRGLFSYIPGVGSLSSATSSIRGAASSVPGVGTLTNAASSVGGLAPSVPGVGTLTSTASGVGGFPSSVPGVGTLTNAASSVGGLATSVPGVGTLTNAASSVGSLATSVPGEGTLTNSVYSIGGLAKSIPGVGALTRAVNGGVFSCLGSSLSIPALMLSAIKSSGLQIPTTDVIINELTKFIVRQLKEHGPEIAAAVGQVAKVAAITASKAAYHASVHLAKSGAKAGANLAISGAKSLEQHAEDYSRRQVQNVKDGINSVVDASINLAKRGAGITSPSGQSE